jgi:hypothetical protein
LIRRAWSPARRWRRAVLTEYRIGRASCDGPAVPCVPMARRRTWSSPRSSPASSGPTSWPDRGRLPRAIRASGLTMRSAPFTATPTSRVSRWRRPSMLAQRPRRAVGRHLQALGAARRPAWPSSWNVRASSPGARTVRQRYCVSTSGRMPEPVGLGGSSKDQGIAVSRA